MARESKTNSYIMPKHEKMDYTPLAKLSRPTQSSAGAIVSKFVYANVISSTSTYVTAQVAAASK